MPSGFVGRGRITAIDADVEYLAVGDVVLYDQRFVGEITVKEENLHIMKHEAVFLVE